jgi:RNA polymerase sigma-70 factor (ECF subfamily)
MISVAPIAADSTEVVPFEDSALLHEAAQGHTGAFAELFRRHYPAIYAFAYRISLCRSDAEDIAQETFVQAARSLAGFRGDASFKNWLYSIAANRSRDRHRQRARRDRLDEQLSTLAATDSGTMDSESAASGAHAAVREALAALSQDRRTAVALVYYEGLNHAEAARVLGCAESTISWRLFRAKHQLKKALRSRTAVHSHA